MSSGIVLFVPVVFDVIAVIVVVTVTHRFQMFRTPYRFRTTRAGTTHDACQPASVDREPRTSDAGIRPVRGRVT